VGFGEGGVVNLFGRRHFEKAFISASVLDGLKSGSFKYAIKTDAMVDAHGYVFIWRLGHREVMLSCRLICIYAWALHIARLIVMGMPEPQAVGRAMVRYPRFFIYTLHIRIPYGKTII
jgi:hypothetical protein